MTFVHPQVTSINALLPSWPKSIETKISKFGRAQFSCYYILSNGVYASTELAADYLLDEICFNNDQELDNFCAKAKDLHTLFPLLYHPPSSDGFRFANVQCVQVRQDMNFAYSAICFRTLRLIRQHELLLVYMPSNGLLAPREMKAKNLYRLGLKARQARKISRLGQVLTRSKNESPRGVELTAAAWIESERTCAVITWIDSTEINRARLSQNQGILGCDSVTLANLESRSIFEVSAIKWLVLLKEQRTYKGEKIWFSTRKRKRSPGL